MTSHERMLYQHEDNDLQQDIWETGMNGRMSMNSLPQWRYGGRDDFWMFSFFPRLIFSSLGLSVVFMS